jgi:hypothetical protein
MLALKYLLMILGVGFFGSAGALVAYDIYLSEQLRRLLSRNKTDESGAEVGALARHPFRPVRWRLALQLTAAGAVTLLFTESFVVIPDGAAGVRVSEIWGARPATLYPGIHLVTPWWIPSRSTIRANKCIRRQWAKTPSKRVMC